MIASNQSWEGKKMATAVTKKNLTGINQKYGAS